MVIPKDHSVIFYDPLVSYIDTSTQDNILARLSRLTGATLFVS